MKTSEAITITVFQLPPQACSPNSRCHWSVRKRAADCFEGEVGVLASQERNKGPRLFPLTKAIVSLIIVVKQYRRRDLDNWWARFKPGMDALVRAGIIIDDDVEHLQHGTITFEVDKTRVPQTIIVVTDADQLKAIQEEK